MGKSSELTFRRGPGERGVRVLIVDTNPVRRARMRDALRADGHEVLVVVGLTQLVFTLQISDDGLAPRADVVFVDVTLGEGIVVDVLRANRDSLGTALLALMLPGADEVRTYGNLEGLEPYASFGPSPDPDDLRTAVLNAPSSSRMRAARVRQQQVMSDSANDTPRLVATAIGESR